MSQGKQPKSGQDTSTKVEGQLVGRRVRITSFDWQRHMTGQLVKVEKYLYILRQESGGVIAIHKHSCGAIAALRERSEGDSEGQQT